MTGDENWFIVTTNADGRLDATIAVSNGLAAGTYYFKLIAFCNGQLPQNTISNSLVLLAKLNENEPNNAATQAVTLPLNGLKTGHVEYYYNLKRDTADWYKVTTNADRWLRLK